MIKMTSKDDSIKLPIMPLIEYTISRGIQIIRKVFRRYRIKRIFKKFNLYEEYNWFINSYNSCCIVSLDREELYYMVQSGILVCVDNNLDSNNTDTVRRIRMNPYLFKYIIF